MAINYSYIRGKIREKYGTEGSFAKSIGVTAPYLSEVLTNKRPMSRVLMEKCIKALDIQKNEIGKSFFTTK